MSAMSPAGDGAIGTGLTATRAHASKDVIDTPEKRIVPDGGDNLASVSSTETRDLHSELDRVKANSADPDEGIPNLNEPWAVGIAIGSIQPGSQDNGTPPRSVRADIAPANEPTTTTTLPSTTITHLATPEVSSFLKGIDLIKLPRSVSEEFVISSSAGGEYPSDTDHGDSQAPDSQPQQKPSLSGKASLTNIALRHADSDECSEVYRNLNYQEDHNHEVPKTWPRAASSSEPSNGRFRFSFSGLRKKLFGTKVTKPINEQQSPVSTAVSSPNPGPGSKINPGTTTTNKKKSRLSVIHKWRCRFWGLKKVETRVGPAGPEPFDTESGKTYLDCLDELKTENEMISIRDEEPPNEPLPFVAGAAQKPSGMFLPTNIEIMSGDGYRMRAGMSIETCRNLPKDHGPIGDFIHPSCIKPDKEELLGIEKSATQDDTTPSQMFFETFFNRLRATVEHHPQQEQPSTTTLSRRVSKTNEDETCVRNSWSADTWEGEPPAHGFYVERNQEDVSHHGESLRKSSSETATHLEHLCNSPAGKLSPADLEFGPMRWFTRTETYVRRRSLSHNYDESDSECSSTTGHSFVGHPCREPYEHLSQEIVCHAAASEQRIRGESSREESPALSGHSSQSINEGFVSRLPELCSELGSEPESLKPATMARHQGGFLHYDDGDKALCSEPLPAQYQLRVPHLNVHKKVSCDTRTASTTERFEDTYDSLETLDQPTSKLLTCPDIFESHLNDAADYRRNFKRKLPSVSESSLASRLSAVSANPTVHKFSQTLLEMIAAVNQKRDALESKFIASKNCSALNFSDCTTTTTTPKSFASSEMQTEAAEIDLEHFTPPPSPSPPPPPPQRQPELSESGAQTEEPFLLVNSCCSATAPKSLMPPVKHSKHAKHKTNPLKRKERVQWDTRLVTTTENAYDVLWYPVTLVAIAVVLPLVYAARRRD